MTISVIMAVFNGSRFLSQAIDSVLSQTLNDFEFIVVNDGSTDSTRQIIESYANKDERIKFVDRAHAGCSAALNIAIEASSYDLIAMMDADDLMMPNRLERQLSFMAQHPNVSVVASHAYFIDIKGRIIGVSQNSVDVDRGRNMCDPKLFSEIVNPSVLMRKKDIVQVGGYRDFYFCPDRDLWGRLVTAGFDIRCQPELLLKYRLHLGAISSQNMRHNSIYADYCDFNCILRFQEREEITFEAFVAEQKKRPWHIRLLDYRNSSALLHYKRATRFRGECMYGRCLGALAIATALDPLHVVKRIWTKWAKDENSKRFEQNHLHPAE